METYIIKRDGKKELFTIDKIKNAMVWSKAASQSRLMSRVVFLRNG